VIYGDVVFDRVLGGTILSTEELFAYLAGELKPARILIAGTEPGVWADYPERKVLLSTLTPAEIPKLGTILAGSENPDVTGGMRSKVINMMRLVENRVCQEVIIFSGTVPGNLLKAFSGATLGTRLHLQ
jgi:isopentenyl phosphate kinase